MDVTFADADHDSGNNDTEEKPILPGMTNIFIMQQHRKNRYDVLFVNDIIIVVFLQNGMNRNIPERLTIR